MRHSLQRQEPARVLTSLSEVNNIQTLNEDDILGSRAINTLNSAYSGHSEDRLFRMRRR